jgi:hypothetical protein
MKKHSVDRICACNHKMRKHVHFKIGIDEKLACFIKDKVMARTRRVNESGERLYRFIDCLYTYSELYKMFELFQQTRSRCGYKRCQCLVFKQDNLRYLEWRYEQSTLP